MKVIIKDKKRKMKSYIESGLEGYYGEKYKELEEEARKSKVKKTVGNAVPGGAGGILAGITSMDAKDGFTIIYDSFHEGLEPLYFWVLDFMRDNYWGAGLEVKKALDNFEASVGGGFFGDIGTRASVMQDRAMKMMGAINTVVRSIVNVIYDLKEFEQRLEMYKNLETKNKEKRNAARLNLKQFWMDKVDVQRGRGSINMLAQQLQFVTLRDAFMAVNNEKEVKKTDLNKRVQRILAPRISEYLAWEKLSGSELEKRYKIEKTYLRSQVNALKLYTQWAKPYLKAAEQLRMTEFNSADLVSTFNNLQLEVNLVGTKETKPSDVNEEWKDFDESDKIKNFYQVIEVGFKFRSVPHTMRQTQTGIHYVQGGRVEINFRGFGLSEDELKAVEEKEVEDGLKYVEGMTTDTLDALQEDLKHYMEDEEEEEKEGVKEENIGKSLFKGFKEIGGAFRKIIPEKSYEFVEKAVKKAAVSGASKTAYIIYNVYKKGHGMYTE